MLAPGGPTPPLLAGDEAKIGVLDRSLVAFATELVTGLGLTIFSEHDGGMARLRPHHGLVVSAAVLSGVAFVVAIVIYAKTQSPLALYFAICVAVGTILTTASVLAARAMIASAAVAGYASSARLTGRLLSPYPRPTSKSRSLPDGGWSWVGGARVPASLGWLNASMPLAVFELVPPQATLRVRGGSLFGAKPVRVLPTDSALCYPVRGWMPGAVGVAIHLPKSAPAYFWTRSTVEILAALAWAGYSVSWEEHRRTWW
jgi:hypothetical protein